MPEQTSVPTAVPKLNILALPSHTFILFALIALVVLGAALASLLPGSHLWWPPIVIGMALLPLRDFLHRPDRHMKRQGLARRAGDTTAIIEAELASLGADKPPMVVTADKPLGAHAFGTFRRRYIGLGRSLAQTLSEGLKAQAGRQRDRFRAILAHELAHFLNRDVWLMWLSYGLLKMMVLVMGLNLWIGVNLSAFIIENGPEVARPEFFENLSQDLAQMLPGMPVLDLRWIYDAFYQQNPTVMEHLADPNRRLENWLPHFFYLVSAHWPFAFSGLVLFVVYWRRLLRVRELYADARAAALMGDASIVLEANALHSTIVALSPVSRSPWKRLEWFSRPLKRIPLLGRQLALHPRRRERKDCLEEPLRAFGSWRWIAISVGLAVALLDFLLRGTLTAAYIYEPGAHLPFLAAFLVFATWLLPQVCMGVSSPVSFTRQVSLIVSLFTLIKLLPHAIDAGLAAMMLLTDPESWGAAIDLWAYSMSGGFASELPRIMGVEVSWPQFINWHVVRPMAYFALLMPPTLVAFLWADAALKRRALTWYRMGGQVQRAFWGTSGVLALALTLVVIPLYNRLLFPHAYDGWSVATLIGMTMAFIAMLVGSFVFWQHDRRLAGRCPGCDGLVSGAYRLGKRCERCGEVLHPWLIANY